MSHRRYPLIDLFSGPGGLGEGFHAFHDPSLPSFEVLISVEKDAWARETLRMRSYFRALQQNNDKAGLAEWYAGLATPVKSVADMPNADLVQEAIRMAPECELGRDCDADRALHEDITKRIDAHANKQHTVLIGGPPCQAYSMAGRSRNMGNADYRAAEDHRHFLYREYLRIVEKVKPSVFVMENVRGLLSSRVDGKRMFPQILNDLVVPSRALSDAHHEPPSPEDTYEIHSFVSDTVFCDGDDAEAVDGRRFLIKAHEYGVPQRRERVILLGIRADIVRRLKERSWTFPNLRPADHMVSTGEVISDLPKIRSKLSKGGDSQRRWLDTVRDNANALLQQLSDIKELGDLSTELGTTSLPLFHHPPHSTGGQSIPATAPPTEAIPKSLAGWYQDPALRFILNHESRGHIASDLMRYHFAAAYGKIRRTSPKAKDFPTFLSPNHANWGSGKFADRFRVQVANKPATTITSHISKDGHYFIHPDPQQCRSLTVREAARLQTFPDNYLFMGPRTSQYVQVGNAVPPYLARQMADIVAQMLNQL